MITTHSRCLPPIERQEMKPKMFVGLLISRAVHSLGVGMVFLYIPIYLFKLGGLELMAMWLMFTGLADFLIVKYCARFSAVFGFKKSILLGQIMFAGGLIFMVLARNNIWFMIPAGALVIISQDLYWITNHLLFLMSPAKNFGNEMSVIDIVCSWSSVIGPVLGAWFAVGTGGFKEVFGIGAIMILASAVPILILEPDNLKWDFHLKHYWEKIGDNWFTKDLLAFVGLGIEDIMYNFIWPVFLLAILKYSYTSLGIYKTIVMAVTTIITWIVGKRIDRGGVHKYMLWATGVLMVFWILRGWLVIPGQLMILDMLDGWVGILVWLPFTVYTYRRAVLADKPLYIVEREASIRFGKVVMGVVFGLMIAFGWVWKEMVMVGVLGLILMNMLPKIGPKHLEEMIQKGD